LAGACEGEGEGDQFGGEAVASEMDRDVLGDGVDCESSFSNGALQWWEECISVTYWR
jgi:hypothetical protein